MSKSIPLHPKYGVNPTIPVCLFCGEEKGGIALLGNNYKGEAPMHMVIDVEPCDACKEKMNNGYVMLVGLEPEAQSATIDIRLVAENIKGCIFVTDDAFKYIFDNDPPECRILFTGMQAIHGIVDAYNESTRGQDDDEEKPIVQNSH